MNHEPNNCDPNPFISVLIPTWNRSDSVVKLIESIGTAPPDLEVIVVDNCSNMDIYDQLKLGLKRFPFVRLYRNDSNIGMVKNWNRCISYAKGVWMSLICSDDTFFDGALMRAYQLLRTLDQPCMVIQDDSLRVPLECFPAGSATAKSLKLPPASGNFWRREVIEKIGGFDERLEYSPDAEFWPRIAYHFPTVKVKEHFARYFSHENSYMWATWEREDFLDQIELITRLNCRYTMGDNYNEDAVAVEVVNGLKQTIITMLEALAFKENRRHLFERYIAKAYSVFKGPEEVKCLDDLRVIQDNYFNPAPKRERRASQNEIPITFSVCVYNEESRIRFVLEHAIRWADEIIVFNKMSTDGTKEICLEYGDRVRVIDIPFSPRGHEDVVYIAEQASNDWIFFSTASEIPTRRLIARIRELLSDTDGQLDLVHVPRKMYSFGIHSKLSPWSVSPYPFLVNRRRAVIGNTIHHNFKPGDPGNIGHIEFAEDCCVYHFTHPSAKAYIHDMAQYFELEAECCTDPAAKIQECFNNIAMYEQRLRQGGNELLGHYCAWPVYWLGTALFIWEKQRSLNVPELYDDIKREVLANEWLSQPVQEGAATASLPLSSTPVSIARKEPVPSEPAQFLVSAIVSTYGSEAFIRGCLDDLTRQTLFGKGLLEIVIINSASPQDEEGIILEFKEKFPGKIKYLRTENRETIYQAWNKGIRLASGKYLTNANTDDRLRSDALEIKAATLEGRPETALVYADQLYTDMPNETFETTSSRKRRVWAPFAGYRTIRSHCMVSSQPMWRRSLHDRYGYFDESYASAGDWEFWLRIGKGENFLKIDQVLGLYYENPDGVENSDPRSNAEADRIRRDYGVTQDEMRISSFAHWEKGGQLPKPLVSVVIPCYNYARYLPEAVGSVIGQTFQGFEIIIVDDGSTDNSRQVAEQLIAAYPQHSIRLITQENSGNPAFSRNRGIAEARGGYILCLDADDMLAPTMLEECLKVLEQDKSISIAYTDRLDFDGVDQVVRAGDYNFELLKYQNHISYCAMFRRKAWEDVGGYRPVGCEDWDFWIAAGASGHYGKRIPLPLFKYRRHDTGRFQQDSRNPEAVKAAIVVNNRSCYTVEEVMAAESLLAKKEGAANSSAPMVSVIVPTHNRPDMLVETIRSILNQTRKDFEIIVVNDAGAGVEGVVNHLNRDGKITYVRHDRNRGLAAARNTGIRLARGKYIAYLDDDDIFYPDHLETLVNFLEGSDFKVAYSDAHRAHQTMNTGRYCVTARDLPYSYDFDYDTILVTNFVPVLCFMHERSCVDQTGPFDEGLTTHEDWDMWIRMSRKYKFAHIKKVTCEFTWRQDGSTMTSSRREDFLRTTRAIYDKHRDLAAGKPAVQEARRNTLQAREQALIAAQPADPAAEMAEPVTATTSSDSKGNAATIERRLERADSLAKDGKYDDAVAAYWSVLRADGKNLRAMTGIGVVRLMNGDLEDAAVSFSDALAVNADDAKALAGLGMVRGMQGRDEEAFACYSRALDSDPENLTALSELLKLSYRLDRFDEAEHRLESYLRYHPADMNMLFSLAGVLMKLGKNDEAIDKLETILLFDPAFEGAQEMRQMIGGQLPIAV